MTEEEKQALNAEVETIIKERAEHINRNYLRVREAYQTEYGWTNLEPLRYEISLALILGLYQSAIALTNHLVESVLKNALIFHHSKDDIGKREGVVAAFVEGSAVARKKYGRANLYENIKAAAEADLITEEERQWLLFVKDRFRNAYSHADKEATFGDTTAPVQGVKLEGNRLNIVEEAEPRLAEMLIGQGLAQAFSAEANAVDYFLDADALVREIMPRVFPSTASPDVAG